MLGRELQCEMCKEEFLGLAEEPCVSAAAYMQKKLPMNNMRLCAISGIHPIAKGHTTTTKMLHKLPVLLTNILSKRFGKFNLEVWFFQVDKNLVDLT